MQEKWDKRYRDSTEPGQACHILREFSHLLPKHGRSLDLACGLGANALFLAERGLDSHAWDISSVGLNKLTGFAARQGLQVTTLEKDIEKEPPAANSFDVIVVSRFLYRPICTKLVNALRPGGLLYYQTFNKDRLTKHGPDNLDYRLDSNELLDLFSSLVIRVYREEGHSGDCSQGLRELSYLVAQKPGH